MLQWDPSTSGFGFWVKRVPKHRTQQGIYLEHYIGSIFGAHFSMADQAINCRKIRDLGISETEQVNPMTGLADQAYVP